MDAQLNVKVTATHTAHLFSCWYYSQEYPQKLTSKHISLSVMSNTTTHGIKKEKQST